MAGRAAARPALKQKEAYKDTKEITGKTAGREAWGDEDILGYHAVVLKVLTDAEMIKEVKIFMTGLQTKMTARSTASALLLTWNLRSLDPTEARVFPETDKGSDPTDQEIVSFEKDGESYIDSDVNTFVDGLDGFNARRAGAFVAASTLKMFAKDASTWSKAWDDDHFSKRYTGFTKCDFPFSGIEPIPGQVEVMYEAYQGQRIYLGTLGRILYALADLEDQRQTSMLFEQHLSCTGMHIVPQFINAKISTGATSADMLSALDMGQNAPTLLQLKKLIDESLSVPLSKTNRGTWRFARLFDASAFSLLQTKYAQDTVAILASINEMSQDKTSKSNPLNIAVIKQMGTQRRSQAKNVAYNIFTYFTVTARGAENEFYNTLVHKMPEDKDDSDDDE